MTVNGINYDELPDAPVRQEPLSRTSSKTKINGQIKRGYFPLLLNGELIPVSVQLNQMSKFAKLQVGKQIVTAKQRKGAQNPLFPLSIAVSGLEPLTKVWVDYQPPPLNYFILRVNGKDYFSLVKEELGVDPT